mmetsp:Transcript_43166/g.90136  ORF Transcript_43166/g.90136 Transcript_43166/m.90136 type:complete len:88 (-) Transcript_43166:532-795(-)|eukprot:1114711-Pleurochrysis_carterae.AAC.1
MQKTRRASAREQPPHALFSRTRSRESALTLEIHPGARVNFARASAHHTLTHQGTGSRQRWTPPTRTKQLLAVRERRAQACERSAAAS